MIFLKAAYLQDESTLKLVLLLIVFTALFAWLVKRDIYDKRHGAERITYDNLVSKMRLLFLLSALLLAMILFAAALLKRI